MMSMLNQAAVEALCSATYLENYLECMENLPDDLQRVVSQLRELDAATTDILQDISTHQDVYINEVEGSKKQRALIQIQRGLISSQEIGDKKLQLVAHIIEFIENRAKQLEQDLDNLDPGAAVIQEDVKPTVATPIVPTKTKAELKAGKTPTAAVVIEEKTETPVQNKGKRSRRQRATQQQQQVPETPVVKEEKKAVVQTTPTVAYRLEEEEKPPKKKKKRKTKQKQQQQQASTANDKAGDKSPLDFPDIDPDEPTYCLCDQVSYGEMIGCDYDSCVIEWFHFNCVGLTNKPKGKWYCPKCRGDKPTVKRADLK